MNDFRKLLYDNYVSTFKQPYQTPKTHSSYTKYFERKYWPFLKSLSRDSQILELGCGSGLMLVNLKSHGFENITGIDISREQVDKAVTLGAEAEEADVFEYLQGKVDHYDLIIAVDFLEHFSKQELIHLLELVHSALKHEGMLFIQTPNGDGLLPGYILYGDFTHMSILNPLSVKQLLSQKGFSNFQIAETGPISVGLSGIIRTLIWSIIKNIAGCIKLVECGRHQKIWTENLICVCMKSEEII